MSSPAVLVTGGSRGLGRAVVEVLVESGATVAFTFSQDEAAAREIVARHAEGRARAYRLDLREAEAPAALVERVESELGPLGALVNNAGIRREALAALMSDADWSEVIEINLAGAFRCCRAVLRGMIHRRQGSIVNVGSLSALHGVSGQAAYAAAKAGLIGLTRSLAREVGRKNIRVNCVIPGFLPTEMTRGLPEARIASLRANECLKAGVDPRSVAETIAFLVSERAGSITGQSIVVDAGASC